MTSKFAKEIEANLSRAHQAISASKILLKDSYPDFAVSRAYYSAFYTATALLLGEGLEFKKHSGVITAIHQKFIKSGKIDKKFGRNLNWLFELRNVGDYGVTTHVPENEAEKAIAAAEEFLDLIKEMLKK